MTAAIDRIAVIAPERVWGPHTPLLMFARLAAANRGALVCSPSWECNDERESLPMAEWDAWEGAQLAPYLDNADPAGWVLIAKPHGPAAMALAADRGLPAVWLAPRLTDDRVVAALRAATAPALLVGGTADRRWNGTLARSVTPHLTEIEHADHNLRVPGPLARSAAVLGEVVTALESFLRTVVWPD